MFFIDTKRIFRRRDLLSLQLVPALVVFLAFIFLTLLGWQSAKKDLASQRSALLQRKNNETAAYINRRINSYEEILRAGVVLINASEKVEPSEWKEYIEAYDAKHRYPDLRGIGFAQVVPADKLSDFVENVRATGMPDFNIFPENPSKDYSIVSMAESISGTGLSKKGFNMYSDPLRAEAMNKARDSGQPVISPETPLFAGNVKSGPNGFLLFLPVYRQGMSTTKPAERQLAIQGFVFAPFESKKLVENSFANSDDNYAFSVSSKHNNSEQMVFQSAKYSEFTSKPGSAQLKSTVSVSSSSWKINGVISPTAIDENTRNRPATSLWGGILFSIFVAGFVYLLILQRSRAITHKEERGIQEAKDELLALASHQLRTPATGVKQYIGMVREGFAGKVSPKQKRLLDKAYASNERQLATINEMLFVARTDAGNLRMDSKRVDLTRLLKEILDEQTRTISQRSQKLSLNLPTRQLFAKGDPQYLRMAIENIVSNATKYTPIGGKIRVSLASKGKNAYITIRDNGVGVNEADIPLLFQKFSRIPNELTNEVSGSGIGLYLAKRVVESHNGTITLQSKENHGTTVTIKLPLPTPIKRPKKS